MDMSNRRFLTTLLAAILILTPGCNEDPVISPVFVTPLPVVHCILSAEDTAHYVRVTRLLSGPVNPGESAGNADSLYFKDIQVFFEIWDDFFMQRLNIIQLGPTFEIPRDSGFFNYNYPLTFKTSERLDGPVRLRIEIPDRNITAISFGSAPWPPVLEKPNPALKRELGFFEDYPVVIFWGNDSLNYRQTIIRMNYLKVTASGIDTCRLDWKRSGGNLYITGKEYLDYIAAWIMAEQAVIYRKITGIDIIMNYGSQAYKTYITRKDWAFDIIGQPYSNIINGYGVFAGRSTDTVFGFLPNQKFLDTLANDPLTHKLRFVTW